MWQAIFRISDGLMTKQFDLLYVLFVSVGWLLFGTMVGIGEPLWFIFAVMFACCAIYVAIFLIITYLRQLCLGRITNTDPFYGGTE